MNLKVNTPWWIRITLLLIRPVVWVYNRAMIMFLSFYVFYGTIFIILFGVGAICFFKCPNSHCKEDLPIVGVQFLLIPFSRPDYLTIADEAWQEPKRYSDEELTEAIALTFLVTSFWFDCFNGIVQFSRRFVLAALFPKYCSLKENSSNPNDNALADHHFMQSSSGHHSLHLSNDGLQLGKQSSANKQSSAEAEISKNSGIGAQTVGNGSGSNLISTTGTSIILKDAASEGFGAYSQQVARAKAKRMDLEHLSDVLRKHTSLSNIADERDDTITTTPIGSNNTNGAATTAAMAAMAAMARDGNNKLSANNVFFDGKHTSISDRSRGGMSSKLSNQVSDRSIPGIDTSADGSSKDIQRDSKKPQTPLDVYRRARASSKHKQEMAKAAAEATRANTKGTGKGASGRARAFFSRGKKSGGTTPNDRESSVETDEDYNSPPAPKMNATGRATFKDVNRSNVRRSRKMGKNANDNNNNNEKGGSNVIAPSNLDMFDQIENDNDENGVEMENMNKYEKYAFKRGKQKNNNTNNNDSVW